MYDRHSDPKQFLMSYEATISSYGGNTAVMAKSFVIAAKSVAQTWYSSLRLGTIMSWQKLKDMRVTSFQGSQTKPVTAQALFQCMEDHEEYLQAYVRRFLHLRAQAPTVPNEIVIEAMIKWLRPGPMAQYFARKPPQTLEKRLQKMDEYIRVDNDFRQRREEAYIYSEMTRGFRGRFHPKHVRTIHNPTQVKTEETTLKDISKAPSLQGRSKVLTGHQHQEVEDEEALEEGSALNPEGCSVYFAGEDEGHTTRMCQVMIKKQKEIAKAEVRQNQPKQVLHTTSCYSPYIFEYVGNQQPTASVASASHSQDAWVLPPPPPMAPILTHNQQPEGHRQASQQCDTREESEVLGTCSQVLRVKNKAT
jgi:hypothetical protein